VTFHSPAMALRRGIAMVSQETAVAPHLSVAENVLLGRRLVRSLTGIDWPATRARASEVLARLGLAYDTRELVANLRPDERQMVEIARALSMEARVLILDEPTSSLTDDEVQALFGVMEKLKDQGVAIVFVSHRLSELFTIADECTILRDGRTVSTGPLRNYNAHTIVAAMVGHEHSLARRSREALRGGDEADPNATLVVRDLVCAGVQDVSLYVRPGEIVGIAGLVGAGRSELLEAIFGMRPVTNGTILLGDDVLPSGDPRASIMSGLGYLPPDRKAAGLVLQLSVADNLNLVCTLGSARLRGRKREAEKTRAQSLARSVRLRAAGTGAAVGTLSGGNQQKVALGKWLLREPKVLLLDEPTRGVDIASKAEIHELLRDAAETGIALLVSSSEYPELLELCDRILVMVRGRVVVSLPAQDVSEGDLASYAGGLVT
jgi:ABC-type sugar transport system ATPase subunit